MARYDLNPKTKLPVREEESEIPVEAYHGKLHSIVMWLIPLIKIIFRVKKPINIENIPKSGGLVIASNHTRWTNAFVAQSVVKPRRLFFIGKSEILKWPIAGKLVKSLGQIPVDRSIRNSRALDCATKYLKNDATIMVFPEGTSNHGEKMLPFKFGAVSIASKAKVPLVPMAVWKGKTMFGKPISVGKDLEKANRELFDSVDKMRAKLMRKPMKHSSGWGQTLLKPPLYLLFKLIYRPQVIGRENIPAKGPVVVASNHIHIFDEAPIVMGAPWRMWHFIAKDEYRASKFRHFINAFGVVFVDRTADNKDGVYKGVKHYISKGHIFVIHPEGTRNKTKKLLLEFKMGAVSFANKNNAVLIPTAIVGWYRPFRKGLKIIFDKPLELTGDLELDNKKLEKRVKKMLVENDAEKNREMIYNYYKNKNN